MNAALLADVETAARRLISGRGRSAIVTLGAAGALAIEPQGASRIPPYRVTAVNTVGAGDGDGFCGVLAAALAQGRPLLTSAQEKPPPPPSPSPAPAPRKPCRRGRS